MATNSAALREQHTGNVSTFTDQNVTISTTDGIRNLFMTISSGDRTVNLPPVGDNEGREITIKKTDSSDNVVTIDANGGETIDGDFQIFLVTQGQSVTLRAAAGSWRCLGGHQPQTTVYEETDNPLTLLSSDSVNHVIYNRSGGGNVSLPAGGAVTNRTIHIQNISNGILNINPGGGDEIDGIAATIKLRKHDGVTLVAGVGNQASNWFVQSWARPWNTFFLDGNNVGAMLHRDDVHLKNTAVGSADLPATARAGDRVRVTDANDNASTFNITINRNGHNINGAASDIVISTDGETVELVYTGSTSTGWRAWKYQKA